MMEIYWSEFAGRPEILKGQARLRSKYSKVLKAYQDGMTGPDIEAKYGVRSATLYQVMRRIGMARRVQGTRNTNAANARAIEMLELRKTMTLDEISKRYGISRERVRQITKKHDPNLQTKAAFWEARRAESITRRTGVCARPGCGKTFVKSQDASNQRYCGSSCAGRHTARYIDEQKHRHALAARISGHSWTWIGSEVYGYKNAQPGACAQIAITNWAARIGYDISYLKGLRGHG